MHQQLEISAEHEGRRQALQRARGSARLSFKRRDGVTVLDELFQSGCSKLRFPRPEPGRMPEAVLINTAGGLTDGDKIDVYVNWNSASGAAVTSQAAERIYRSRGAAAQVETGLTAGEGALALWLPQETILFDGGRLRRANRVELAEGAEFLGCEAVLFGRAAMGEDVLEGEVFERWDIRRQGRLVFADRFGIEGAIRSTLARPAVARGARAAATLIYAGRHAARIDAALQEALDRCGCAAGCSVIGEVVAARIVSPCAQHLRTVLGAAILAALKAGGMGQSLPRAWML